MPSGVALAFALAVASFVAIPGTAAAATPSVCLALAPEMETRGLSRDSLQTAWTLETRKRGLTGHRPLIVRSEALQCPAGSSLVATINGLGQLMLADRFRAQEVSGSQVTAVALLTLEAWERPAEVARVIAGAVALNDEHTGAALGVVKKAPATPTPQVPSDPVRLGLEVGGLYLPQAGPGSHRGALELGLGVGLMKHRQLTLMLRAAWQPPQELSGAATTTQWHAVEAGLDVQLRFPINRWALGLGLQLGAEFRSVEVRDASRLQPITASDTGFVTTAAMLVDYTIVEDVHLSAMAGVRVQVNRTAYTWLGDPLYTGPLATGIVGLRVAWWFL